LAEIVPPGGDWAPTSHVETTGGFDAVFEDEAVADGLGVPLAAGFGELLQPASVNRRMIMPTTGRRLMHPL
jgi:hypothetical protein